MTSVAVIPNGGLLGGQIAVMNLDGWSWEQAAVKTGAGVSFQFPVDRRWRGGGGGGGGGQGQDQRRYEDLKRERDARVKKVEDLIAQARAYGKIPAAERRTDWNLEALVPIVEGRAPLFVQASNEREIRDAVAFADRTGVKIVDHRRPRIAARRAAPQGEEHPGRARVGADDADASGLPSCGDVSRGRRAGAGRREVRVRHAAATPTCGAIPYEAAISVAWGLDRDRALRALTVDAAEILGVADRIGSLEPGKVANVVIWNGDPLEIRTPLPRVFIAGRDVGPDNKHLALYQKFSSRPAPAPRSGGASAPPAK